MNKNPRFQALLGIFLSAIVLLITSSCNRIYWREHKIILDFSEKISPIYFVDTVRIEDAMLVMHSESTWGGVCYVVPKSYLDSVERETIADSRYAVRLLNRTVMACPSCKFEEVFTYRSRRADKGYLLFEEVYDDFSTQFNAAFNYVGEVDSMKVFGFVCQPQAFIISMAPRSVIKSSSTDFSASDVAYSKVYMPCATPIYTSQEWKIIRGY